jgi:hypothetical protein
MERKPTYSTRNTHMSPFKLHIQSKKKRERNIKLCREGPQCFETSRFPHFLDYRFTDSGEVVSLTRRPLFTIRG